MSDDTIVRSFFRVDKGGELQELRLTLGSFARPGNQANGATVSLRLWYRAGDKYLPTQKGVSIKAAELREIATGLLEIASGLAPETAIT